MVNRWGNNGNSERLYFLGLQNHCGWWLQPWSQKTLAPWKKSMTNLDSILKSWDVTLPTKVRLVKAFWFFQWSCDASAEMSLRHVAVTTLLKAEGRRTSVLFYPEEQGLPPKPHVHGQVRAAARARPTGRERGRAETARGRSRRQPAELFDGQCPPETSTPRQMRVPS